MGTSDCDTPSKGPKASASQEQPPATISTPPATVYPDWSGFQAYSLIPPPGFFHPPGASTHGAHPYMWGAQHFMPPFGTPPPAYLMYPPGVYAHPSISPGYSLPSTNGHAETYGSFSGGMEGDAKSSEWKEKNPIQRSKENHGSLNMITRSNKNVLDKMSGAANGSFSQSSDSGSEGSSEGSDGNSQNDLEPKAGDRRKSSDEASKNGTTPLESQNGAAKASIQEISHQAMAIVPIAAGIPGVFAGATTNLNIGMDYWVAPTPSHIPPMHGKVPVSTAAGAIIPGTLVGATEKVPSEIWLQDERELKRQRRKQSNRESARRSRLRKQAECEQLAQHVEHLEEENTALREEAEQIKQEYNQLLSLNTSLKERLGEEVKRKEDATLEGSRQHVNDSSQRTLDSDPKA